MLRRPTYVMRHNCGTSFSTVRAGLSVLIASALLACFATPALGANQAVNVVDNAFIPDNVGVRPGDSVTWTASSGNPHNVHFEDGGLIAPLPAIPGPWTTARTFAAAGAYRYYCDIHGSPGGAGMAGTVFVNATGNVPPLARFTLSSSLARTGQAVNFDASGSRDSDGTIAQYEWDLDGNGSFETNSGTAPTVSRTYASPGTFNVKLRVTDNTGASGEATLTLEIAAAPVAPPPQPGTSALAGASPLVGSSLLPPSFAASKRSIVVSSSGRFDYTLRAGAGLTGTISLRSVTKVTVSAKRRISLGTKRFTVPTSGTVTVNWRLSRRNLQILKRRKRIRFRATVTLRNVAGATSSGASTLTLKRPRR